MVDPPAVITALYQGPGDLFLISGTNSHWLFIGHFKVKALTEFGLGGFEAILLLRFLYPEPWKVGEKTVLLCKVRVLSSNQQGHI